jgi:hypothetical protein
VLAGRHGDDRSGDNAAHYEFPAVLRRRITMILCAAAAKVMGRDAGFSQLIATFSRALPNFVDRKHWLKRFISPFDAFQQMNSRRSQRVPRALHLDFSRKPCHTPALPAKWSPVE